MFGFPSSKVWAAAGVLLAVALIALAGYGYGYGSGKADATAEAAEALIEAGAELVVVVEYGAAQRLLGPSRHLHQPLVALPRRGVEQLLAALGGHGLAGDGGLTVIAAVFAVVVFVFVLAF